MTDSPAEAKSFVKSVRVFLTVSGVIALAAGIILLVWPGKSATVIAGIAVAIIGAYFIIGGLVYIALAIFSREKGGWSRVGHILLGLLYVVAGVIMFANFYASSAALIIITMIFIGVSWIVDGVVSLSLLKNSTSRVWTLLYAILSIIAGIVVFFAPLYTAAVLWIIVGITLVVLGVVQIVRAITLKTTATEAEFIQ
ncbi:HdeD family acid-resistance protein [Microbacterium alcoholitolerans]|uniref:HdeD family acid-resistance protein n=1 Tax=unclassified Microbacterium TaxID=2609290 RepID=UPI003D1732C6